jgi:hypothetical protein
VSALPRAAAGHSLGGAVAQLCALDLLHGPASDQPCEGPCPDPALDLLHAAGRARTPAVAAIGWATPAVGNATLAELVAARGWGARLVTFLLPGALPAPPLPCRCLPMSKGLATCAAQMLTCLAPGTMGSANQARRMPTGGFRPKSASAPRN